MGQVIGKNVPDESFSILYQCACGGPLVHFKHEQKVRCAGCDTVSQCRIIIGRPGPVKKVVTP